MIIILLMVASILALTAVMVGINATRVLPWGICPICAGVSGTWLWMLLGMFTGKLPITNYQLPVAILMGGSIVGIAYQLEDRVRHGRSAFAWKVSFMTIGFALVMGVLMRQWSVAVVASTVEFWVVWWFLFPGMHATKVGEAEQAKRMATIEEKMEKCC